MARGKNYMLLGMELSVSAITEPVRLLKDFNNDKQAFLSKTSKFNGMME
ncbi:MAG: hypothetical protein WD625_01635 [Balneolales bacterium]